MAVYIQAGLTAFWHSWTFLEREPACWQLYLARPGARKYNQLHHTYSKLKIVCFGYSNMAVFVVPKSPTSAKKLVRPTSVPYELIFQNNDI